MNGLEREGNRIGPGMIPNERMWIVLGRQDSNLAVGVVYMRVGGGQEVREWNDIESNLMEDAKGEQIGSRLRNDGNKIGGAYSKNDSGRGRPYARTRI